MNILHAFFVVVLAVIVTADGSASSWNASDAFPEDVTAFASSAAAIRDDERIVDLCLRVSPAAHSVADFNALAWHRCVYSAFR